MQMSINELKKRFDQHLQSYVQTVYGNEDRLSQACAYALRGQGKRVRPLLVLLSSQACGGKDSHALDAALAVEMVHTYSLVHDDLPICDNDDLRRGQPTVHVKFDPASALLCGDALLSDAFTLLGGMNNPNALSMVKELSLAMGGRGMVLGQMMDITATGKTLDPSKLDLMHTYKTGKLIGSACALGGLCAGASQDAIENLRKFGEHVGLAFQIVDDLLDEKKGTGKSQGKDVKQGKFTYLTLMNREEAEQKAKTLTSQARNFMANFDDTKKKPLLNFVDSLLAREK